jgi:hypothetical protein
MYNRVISRAGGNDMRGSKKQFLYHSPVATLMTVLLVLILMAMPIGASAAYAWDLEGYQNITPSWESNTMSKNNSVYQEGQSIPFRLTVSSGDSGPFVIEYEFMKVTGGGTPTTTYFFDHLATPPSIGGYDYIGADGGPASPASPDSTAAIPATGFPDAAGDAPSAPGQFLWGYGVTGLTASTPSGYTSGGITYRSITVDFTGASGWIVWGGHLADSTYWGDGKGAGDYSGASGDMQAVSASNKIGVNPDIIANVEWIFDQTGISGDFTGTVLTIDGVNYVVTQLPYTALFQADTEHTFAYQSPLLVSANTKQYVWTSTTATSPAPSTQSGTFDVGSTGGTVTGNYKTQYYLTLAITSGVPGGLTNISGGTTGTWYDSGTALTLGATTPVADGAGKRWEFRNWTGDVASPPNSTNPVGVTMDQARSITANYMAQYLLTY